MLSLHIHSTRTRFHSVKTLADTKLEGERRIARRTTCRLDLAKYRGFLRVRRWNVCTA